MPCPCRVSKGQQQETVVEVVPAPSPVSKGQQQDTVLQVKHTPPPASSRHQPEIDMVLDLTPTSSLVAKEHKQVAVVEAVASKGLQKEAVVEVLPTPHVVSKVQQQQQQQETAMPSANRLLKGEQQAKNGHPQQAAAAGMPVPSNLSRSGAQKETWKSVK